MAVKEDVDDDPDVDRCERCEKPCEFRIGCNQCAKLVCPECLAILPEDEQEERGDICKACF